MGAIHDPNLYAPSATGAWAPALYLLDDEPDRQPDEYENHEGPDRIHRTVDLMVLPRGRIAAMTRRSAVTALVLVLTV